MHGDVLVDDHEEWRPIPSAPGYWASNLGRIGGFRTRNGRPADILRPLKPTIDPAGYPTVTVYLDLNHGKKVRVHRLIAEVFHGPAPFPGAQVRHLSGVPGDSSPGNLAWGTQADNEADKVTHGTSNRGERNGRAKFARSDIDEMRLRATAEGATRRELMEAFGISASHLSSVLNGKYWAEA